MEERVRVRRATSEDIEWLVTELRKFAEFFGSKHSLVGDETFWRDGLTVMVNQHVVFISETDADGRVGLIAGYLVGHPFNPKIRLLSEAFWWVSEKYRMSRAGLLLLNAFVEHGEKHADWITMALETKSPMNEKCLIKRGFHLHERSFLREI